MAKKPTITQDEIDAFHRAMAGTKPLIQKKVKITATTPIQKPVKQQKIADEPLIFSETADIDIVGSEGIISYKQGSVPNKILRKLRKGQYNIDAILDLHGMTIEEARNAVNHFLQQCLHEGLRVALIIHGKGHHSHMPILKNKLNHWLRDINMVLAFCSAAPAHGSRGAMYVLLKRTTEENNN